MYKLLTTSNRNNNRSYQIVFQYPQELEAKKEEEKTCLNEHINASISYIHDSSTQFQGCQICILRQGELQNETALFFNYGQFQSNIVVIVFPVHNPNKTSSVNQIVNITSHEMTPKATAMTERSVLGGLTSLNYYKISRGYCYKYESVRGRTACLI